MEGWLGGQVLTDGLLATYITELHHQGKSPSTIAKVVAAVKWTASKSHIDVERIAAFAEADKTIAGLRDSAMIRLMSDCLLRISEAVAVNVEDLSDSTLIVHRSKTDQTGEGAVLFVGKETIDLIRRYQAVSEVSSGALFRRIRRGDTVTSHRLTLNGARQA